MVHIFESDLGERYRRGDKSNLITVRNGVFQNWRNQARCFESIAAAQYTQATLTDGDRASVADVNLVDEGF
ncbi:MAG TPA: hypothetical protein VHZ55_26270, partial [Bryobacteraceae bacterium]|nr:hypothetical protein [Bryobacteraceae bacterium]